MSFVLLSWGACSFCPRALLALQRSQWLMWFALANISSLTACPGRHREERQSSSEFSAADGTARRGGRGTWSPGLEPALVLWRAPWGQVGSVAISLLAWRGCGMHQTHLPSGRKICRLSFVRFVGFETAYDFSFCSSDTHTLPGSQLKTNE